MNKNADQEARKIAEDLQDRTARSLETGDFEACASCFHFPFRISTDIEETVTSRDEFREVFFRIRWNYRAMGVTSQWRKLLIAQPISEDIIIMVHLSHLYRGSKLVHAPFKVVTTVRKFGDDWLITDNAYALEGSMRLARSLHGQVPYEGTVDLGDVPPPVPLHSPRSLN